MIELLSGERLDWEGGEDPPSVAFSNAEIDQKYVRGEVRIVTEQGRYPLSTIRDLVRSTNYDLNPTFQRRHRWSPEKQSRLIESFIMNVPVPPVFLYEDSYGHYEVMDGLQRLTAITDFYEDRLILVGLDEWPELIGRRYSDLPDQVQRGIDRRYLSSVVLLYETAKNTAEAQRLKQLVFERINSGGVDLTAQETRNALFPGPMNDLCVVLARNPSLCRLWGIPEPTTNELTNGKVGSDVAENTAYQRMEDVELVLRFFAHRQRTRLLKSGRLDRYLDRYVQHANRFSRALLTSLREVFEGTIAVVEDVLGARAFWLYRERQGKLEWVDRPTLIGYDSVMFAFSSLLQHADRLRERADSIRARIAEFYEANYEVFDGRKVNAADVQKRDETMLRFLRSVVSDGG